VSRAAVSDFPSSKPAVDVAFSVAGLVAAVEIWRRLKKAIFDPYRPELHYMRGPGPKWREQHAATSGAMRWDGRYDRQAGLRALPEDQVGDRAGPFFACGARGKRLG
jgi:hypothetical protein